KFPTQLRRTQETLRRGRTAALGGGVYGVGALLYCPDYAIRDASIAGVAADRIVDASRKAQLGQVILQILPEDDEHFPNAPKLHHFLADELALTPDTSALVGQAGTLVTRLSGGLASWAPQPEFAPFRLPASGTAAPGQTHPAVPAFPVSSP
ncbi:nuclease, partial [Pseudomonas sp. MWU13-2625]